MATQTKRNWRYGLVGLSALFAAGCSYAPHREMPQAAREQLAVAQLVVVHDQDNIGAEFILNTPTMEAMDGGLLWLLADYVKDSPRREAQQQALAPIRAKLAAYDFATRLAETLDRELDATPWLAVSGHRVVRAMRELRADRDVPAVPGGALMIFDTEYRLTPSLTTLRIESIVSIYAREARFARYATPGGELADAHLLYRKKLMHQHSLIGVGNDQHKAAALWLANDGERLLAELDRGMKRLASRLVFDLEYSYRRSN